MPENGKRMGRPRGPLAQQLGRVATRTELRWLNQARKEHNDEATALAAVIERINQRDNWDDHHQPGHTAIDRHTREANAAGVSPASVINACPRGCGAYRRGYTDGRRSVERPD